MATHSNILAWRLPWTEEPGGPQSIASQRVRNDLVTELAGTQSAFLPKSLKYSLNKITGEKKQYKSYTTGTVVEAGMSKNPQKCRCKLTKKQRQLPVSETMVSSLY